MTPHNGHEKIVLILWLSWESSRKAYGHEFMELRGRGLPLATVCRLALASGPMPLTLVSSCFHSGDKRLKCIQLKAWKILMWDQAIIMTHINFSPLKQCTKAGLWILTQLGVEKRRSGRGLDTCCENRSFGPRRSPASLAISWQKSDYFTKHLPRNGKLLTYTAASCSVSMILGF